MIARVLKKQIFLFDTIARWNNHLDISIQIFCCDKNEMQKEPARHRGTEVA